MIGSETMTDSRSDDSSSNTVVKVTPAELSHTSQTWLPVAARYVDAEDTVMFRSGGALLPRTGCSCCDYCGSWLTTDEV